MKWTMRRGVALARTLEQALKAVGYHVALAGGVLHRGASDHDLDLIVFPHNCRAQNKRAVRRQLEALGMRRTHSCARMHEGWRTRGSTDTKFVEAWCSPCGRRVDLIYLS